VPFGSFQTPGVAVNAMAVNAMAAKAEAVAAASSCFMILPYSRSGLEDGGAGKKAITLAASPGVWNEAVESARQKAHSPAQSTQT
jgi:hypothetical protein